jgi:hypothetical protein
MRVCTLGRNKMSMRLALGGKAADLLVCNSTKIEPSINLEAAKTIEITLPALQNR